MIIYFDDDKAPDKATEETMTRAASLCAANEDLDPERLSLSVSFVGKDEIHELNREYRGVDSVTDVLSFPQFDREEYDRGWDEISLGDVVICEEKAKEQAAEYGHSFERELIYLFTHSVLHLLGYDHMEEAEKKEMREAEERVMKELGLARQE